MQRQPKQRRKQKRRQHERKSGRAPRYDCLPLLAELEATELNRRLQTVGCRIGCFKTSGETGIVMLSTDATIILWILIGRDRVTYRERRTRFLLGEAAVDVHPSCRRHGHAVVAGLTQPEQFSTQTMPQNRSDQIICFSRGKCDVVQWFNAFGTPSWCVIACSRARNVSLVSRTSKSSCSLVLRPGRSPNVHKVLSHLRGHVADIVGAITDILGGSHGAGSQGAVSEYQFYVEGAAVLVDNVTCLVVAPAILTT